MNLRLRQKMEVSQNFLEIGRKVWLRQKRSSLGKFSQNWNEVAATTEIDIVFEQTCRIRSNLRLRQKMIFA